MDYEKIAQRAYKAYAAVTGNKNYQGLQMPEWDALPAKIQEAWRAAVHSVVEDPEVVEALQPRG